MLAREVAKRNRAVLRGQEFLLLLALVLGLTVLVYWRGLRGVFLFDDFANLPVLGAFGPIDNWTAFLRYLTSGLGDPTGRPLAMLSFLIDAHNWPADPYPFKRTNLILHLCNGVLLALLLRRLGRIQLPEQPIASDRAAVLGAAFWLLHPLLVSTTLYVVQREAMLPATFMLLGLLGYCSGRARLARGDARGIWLCAASIGASTFFAVASKANGALLPLLALLVEWILLAPKQPVPPALKRRYDWMRALVLVLPTLAVIAYLFVIGSSLALHGTGSFRPWTLSQRLMTEARVVCEYLSLLWLPHPYTAGLFNDAVKLSTGLLSPPSTLAAIVAIVAILGVALAIRRRAPTLSLAILFYFAAHLLESTVVPLELYYEHRNYVPALLLFWPLALWLAKPAEYTHARRILALLLVFGLAGMTYMNADLWGNASQQALVWAEKNPDSPRAQAYAAAAERALGQPERAAARMRRVSVDPNEDIQIALNQVGAECELGQVRPETLERAAAALQTTRTAGQLYFNWMSGAIAALKSGTACRGLDAAEIGRLLDAMDRNKKIQNRGGWLQDNFSLRADLALAMNDPRSALNFFNQALAADPRAEVAIAQAARLGSANYPAEGVAHLDFFRALPKPPTPWHWSMASVHVHLLEQQHYFEDEVSRLRDTLQHEATSAGKPAVESP